MIGLQIIEMISDRITADSAGIGMTAVSPPEQNLILCGACYRIPAYRAGCEHRIIIVPADEAGIHSATLLISGFYPFGMLSSERGVHRLVRISPYDAAKRRHTSFAKVEVVPQLADDSQIELRPEDLKIDTYHSQGAGGQHVNKTESAVRITHIPTGTVAACQNERSQHSNKETALRMLKAKLLEMKLEQRQDTIDSVKGENREAAWANQIRNYVLHPYTMVKDRRTGYEDPNFHGVLSGQNLEAFMISWLQARAQLGREPTASDGAQ